MAKNSIRVGGHDVPLSTAEAWVATYFDADANQAAKKPYAYPFYDHFKTKSGSNELDDGDLLVATLLNAAPTIRGYRTLQGMRPRLEAGLAKIPVDLTLENAVADGAHAELLADLADVLDGPDPDEEWTDIKGTILAKTLHRKRPLFMPLYDTKVFAAYVGPASAGYPMPKDGKRSWARFFAQLAECMVRDLTGQREQWHFLAASAPRDVVPLRLLDVVAWNVGKQHG